MDTRGTRAPGWQTFSGLVLALGGIFALTYGLMAVYRSMFFVADAGLAALGQLMTAQAYPIWSLMLMGVMLTIYGLAVYGVRESTARSGTGYIPDADTTASTTPRSTTGISEVSGRERRAA